MLQTPVGTIEQNLKLSSFLLPPPPLLGGLYRHALTEVGVLSDLLQIAKHHHNYIALDPVVQQSSTAVEASPSYQILAKKKVRDSLLRVR